jgi:hypothetical protein
MRFDEEEGISELSASKAFAADSHAVVILEFESNVGRNSLPGWLMLNSGSDESGSLTHRPKCLWRPVAHCCDPGSQRDQENPRSSELILKPKVSPIGHNLTSRAFPLAQVRSKTVEIIES